MLNQLEADFQTLEANTTRVVDITEIKRGEGWLYLCVVLNLFSNKKSLAGQCHSCRTVTLCSML